MYTNYKIHCAKSTKELPEIKDFIKKYHYLKTVSRGNKYCFVLYIDNVMCGVAIFGTPVGKMASDIIELKRFVLIPGLLKNTPSWFMSKCIRQITGYSKIISYANPEQGHEGIIYKASNFKYNGVQKYRTSYYKIGKRKIYSRNVYDKSGKYSDIKWLIKEKVIRIKYEKPKHIFTYEL